VARHDRTLTLSGSARPATSWRRDDAADRTIDEHCSLSGQGDVAHEQRGGVLTGLGLRQVDCDWTCPIDENPLRVLTGIDLTLR
jgi:hypothetical protein